MPVVQSTAEVMQRWIVDWAVKGDGSGSAALQIPKYTAAANVVNITGTRFPVVADPTANARSRFWLDGLASAVLQEGFPFFVDTYEAL